MEENYLKSELYNLISSDASIFEFIQSGSLDGMWYWDLENYENEWLSPKFWQTLGYDADEKQHRSSEWQDIIFQEDLEFVKDNFEKHCANPDYPFDQIVRYKHKNGSTVWIRCRGLAIRDEKGKAVRMLGAHTDITELKEKESEISRLTIEYEKVFNGTQDAMFLINVLDNNEFRYIRNNVAHQNKTGLLLEQLMNKSPQELLGSVRGQLVEKYYQKCLDTKDSIRYEEELSLPEGMRIWLTTLTPIFEDNRISHIVGSASDITERKKLESELEIFANYDKLTGLPNRRLFFERLERMVVEHERDQSKFVLLFIDLDGFKDINDNYGHVVGDEVLVTVGNRLANSIRKSDTVARMGGDEFTIILRNIEKEKNVRLMIEKIHKKLREDMYIGDKLFNIDSSIGVARYPNNGKNGETLLRNADSTMYETKRSGKGGFKFYRKSSENIT